MLGLLRRFNRGVFICFLFPLAKGARPKVWPSKQILWVAFGLFFWVYPVLGTILDNARSRFDNCASSFMIDLKSLLFFDSLSVPAV